MLSQELKKALNTLADTLEILGEETFRIHAYRRAALIVAEISEHDLQTLSEKELISLPGIGEGIAKKIIQFRKTGHITVLDQKRKKIPPGLFELLKIPGLGPKSIRQMWFDLGIENKKQFIQSLEDGSLKKTFGFGDKKIQNFKKALHLVKKSNDRIPFQKANMMAKKLIKKMKSCPEVKKIVLAGSLRRKQKDIGDIDLLVESNTPKSVIDFFCSLPEVTNIIAKGTTKASVRIQEEGRQVDLRVVPKKSFGSALQYFTGSKEHNILLRQRAQKKGLKLSEYGLFRGNKHIAGETEEEIYKILGVPMVSPEKRLGKKEFE